MSTETITQISGSFGNRERAIIEGVREMASITSHTGRLGYLRARNIDTGNDFDVTEAVFTGHFQADVLEVLAIIDARTSA